MRRLGEVEEGRRERRVDLDLERKEPGKRCFAAFEGLER